MNLLRPVWTYHPSSLVVSKGNPSVEWPGGTNPNCVRWSPFLMDTRLELDVQLLEGIEWERVGIDGYDIGRVPLCEPGQGMISDVISRAAAPAELVEVLDRFEDDALAEFAAKIGPCQESPFASRWWVKRYRAGDYHGMHYDTNSITILGYVTDGMSTVQDLGGGRWAVEQMRRGDVACFDGRHTRHAAAVADVDRIVVGINAYVTDDVWRPKEMDATIYGPSAVAE